MPRHDGMVRHNMVRSDATAERAAVREQSRELLEHVRPQRLARRHFGQTLLDGLHSPDGLIDLVGDILPAKAAAQTHAARPTSARTRAHTHTHAQLVAVAL